MHLIFQFPDINNNFPMNQLAYNSSINLSYSERLSMTLILPANGLIMFSNESLNLKKINLEWNFEECLICKSVVLIQK